MQVQFYNPDTPKEEIQLNHFLCQSVNLFESCQRDDLFSIKFDEYFMLPPPSRSFRDTHVTTPPATVAKATSSTTSSSLSSSNLQTSFHLYIFCVCYSPATSSLIYINIAEIQLFEKRAQNKRVTETFNSELPGLGLFSTDVVVKLVVITSV